jgi:ABC-type lipoprotein release transport system permease subunit
MGVLFKLAARNLRRHVRRTLLTASSVSLGLALLIMGSTLGDGMHRDTVKIAVSQMAGHVVLQAKGFQEDRKLENVIDDATARQARLHKEFPDATIVPRAFLQGLLTSTGGSMGVALTAVDPEVEKKLNDIDDKIVEGEFIGDKKTDLVIGTTLADTLDVQVGDKVVLMIQSGNEVESQLFRVKGLFKTGMEEMDGFFGLVPLSAAHEILGKDDAVHQLAVIADMDDDLKGMARRASAVAGGPNIEALTWPEAIPEVHEFIVLDDLGLWIFLAIIVIIGAIGVLNTVLMSVLERVREFGVMLSLGMSQRRLASIVIIESLLIGAVSALLGLAIGIAGSIPLENTGIDYSALMGTESMSIAGVSVSTVMYGYLDYGKAILFTGITVVVTVLAGVYPVWWAARLTPIKALAHR